MELAVTFITVPGTPVAISLFRGVKYDSLKDINFRIALSKILRRKFPGTIALMVTDSNGKLDYIGPDGQTVIFLRMNHYTIINFKWTPFTIDRFGIIRY
jgi:hypothetical protein